MVDLIRGAIQGDDRSMWLGLALPPIAAAVLLLLI